MPITINPITVQQTIQQPLVADSLYLPSVVVNGGDPNKNPIPSVTIVSLPYAANGGSPIYPSLDQATTQKTKDIYAAAENIPEIGVAMQAVFAAVQAWQVWMAARQVDLINSQSALITAETNVATAQAAVTVAQVDATTAQDAVTAAQDALNDVPAGQDTTAAQAAVDAAQAVLETKQTNLATKQTILDGARDGLVVAMTNLDISKLAVVDPANPKVS